MIQTLSNRFRRYIAALLYVVFYLQVIFPFYSMAGNYSSLNRYPIYNRKDRGISRKAAWELTGRKQEKFEIKKGGGTSNANRIELPLKKENSTKPVDIGGPGSPEAGSFKAVGSDNLVNLFTGDFSYSIPLLDVGGYPVNLFYNGGISMEQEASWVGLGWNINPGSVSRNMRGVPDDFDGTDILIQEQNVKPNKTWGAELGIDGEMVGIKEPKVNFNLGFSYNNYLGPELELGAGVSVSIPITKTIVHEKSAPNDTTQGLNVSFGANAKLSSRSGLTLSPSLNAGLHSVSQKMDVGVGLSTSYNSRTGIKDLNIHSEMKSYRTVSSGIKNMPSYKGSFRTDISNTTISFARPSYIPALRMPMQYSTTSGQIELGTGMFGLRGAATAQGYSSISKVADGCTTINKPMVGFLYLEKAKNRKDVVMDFNRLNDGEVTPHTPVISAPQYDYDIFTIQGEGTGGSIRAYRGDLGIMRDQETNSKDNNFSIGFDIAPAGHFGGNWNIVSSPTRSGNWDDGNNTLNQTLVFNGGTPNNSFQNVYFRNPGEATITNDMMINKMGGDNLVRFKLDGSSVSPRLESQLEQFGKKTGTVLSTIPISNTTNIPSRDKRTQVITMLTAEDAGRIGLDTILENYQNSLDSNNNLQFNGIPRTGGYRKAKHISEISVLESSGMRYVYGLPVYNKIQKDFTFSVSNNGNATSNLVNFNPDEPTINSGSITGSNGIDGYTNIQTIPAYASSFLITGLLSPDYVDVTGNGITEDDLGGAVKFDYTMSSSLHKWRTPRNNSNGNTAHFNIGLKTERRDNKATMTYGEREAWYLHGIESKSMIALFNTSSRQDSKGVNGEMDGSINANENANLKLDSIVLYTKADIKAHGLGGAVPVKTVHFEYNYALCNGTPDNSNGGKLTLVNIYFTFNGQSRASKNMYVFDYGNVAFKTDNPLYSYNASDRWGTYKPMTDSAGSAVNPNGLSNIDYPYTSQNKEANDIFAGAWTLKKILLPSGGQMEMQYEADDYSYVQNRRACNMFRLYGLGNSVNYAQNNMLYSIYQNQDQNYAYIQLPTPLQNTDPLKIRQEIYSNYLEGITQLAFKLNINMPKGMEPLTVYANYDDYGLCANSADRTVIYLKLRPVDGKGPLANASVHFLIENLPGQAFPGYDLSDETGIAALFDLITSELGSLENPFRNAETQMRSSGNGSTVSLVNSFVRLNSPSFIKYGGGYRVKRITVKDNWNPMSNQYTSQYGQDYDYTTSITVSGSPITISSGVASYEPGIGSEENPFREILQFENKLPLASAQYGSIEMPALEGLYPAPLVGYSKVTVRSIHRNGTHADSIVKSAIGKQVTEFFTARDYPSFSAYTPLFTMDYHKNPPFTFFYKETIDKRACSQGFLVETNDMHGKLKSQSVFSENDGVTPLSYTLHTYKNTGSNGLNDLVDFVHNEQSGKVSRGNMGIDMELMTDVREFIVISNGFNGQAQVDFFTFVPWPVFGVFIYPLEAYSENKYRAVTTTKLINYHAIEDSVIINDKGSTVTSKTIAYDGETGNPLLTKTMNEFNDPIYNTTYPAYWAYSGMGPAYQNIDMQFSGVNISSGKITSGIADLSVFESGDELYIDPHVVTTGSPSCVTESPYRNKVWVFDTNKNNTALTVPSANRNLMILDSAGLPFTKAGVSFRVVRSGKRNELGLSVGSATSMQNPIQTIGGIRQLIVNNTANVVAASAIDYKEKWKTDNDEILKTSLTFINCAYVESIDCNGTLQKHVNPYVIGLVGNYKPCRSYSYYGARAEMDPAVNTTIRKNGYLSGFNNYWGFNSSNNLVPDNTNTNWVWNSELIKVNAKGQELETRDPLNRYTAAQYGYSKNFPIAITNNAMYTEAAYEGMEDIGYNEKINKSIPYTCSARHFDLTNLANARLVNTDTAAFTAHSGKYVMAVNANSVVTKPLNLNPVSNPDFSLQFGTVTSQVLNNLGGNYTIDPTYPNSLYFSPPTFSFGTSAVSIGVFPNSNTLFHRYNVAWDTYIQIANAGTYNFNMILRASYNGLANATTYSNNMTVIIYDLNGNPYGGGQSVSMNIPFIPVGQYTTSSYSVYLCKGIYHILGSCNERAQMPSSPAESENTYEWNCSNCGSPDYASLTTQAGCTSNTPIAGDSSMLNPVFSLPANKQIALSAWVREDCGNAAGVPCYRTNYSNNHMAIQFPGSVIMPYINFYPRGVIIEGWQKIDTVFSVPSDASTANLVLANDSLRNVYFDDIRLHPFNAEMKSYIYDPRTLRLSAELDENNYATFYDYDEEGQLIRLKKETIQGIKTIKEIRSAKQKSIKTVQ
ncbi:hypothetical protein ACX0G9_08545 [Flavitalea flava]